MATVFSVTTMNFADTILEEGDLFMAQLADGTLIKGFMNESAWLQGDVLDLHRDDLPPELRHLEDVSALHYSDKYVLYFDPQNPPKVWKLPYSRVDFPCASSGFVTYHRGDKVTFTQKNQTTTLTIAQISFLEDTEVIRSLAPETFKNEKKLCLILGTQGETVWLPEEDDVHVTNHSAMTRNTVRSTSAISTIDELPF